MMMMNLLAILTMYLIHLFERIYSREVTDDQDKSS